MDLPGLVESSTPAWKADTTTRPRSYVGTQSDSYTFRRHSVDETAMRANSNDRPAKLQIQQVINKTNDSSHNDVEFIIQV